MSQVALDSRLTGVVGGRTASALEKAFGLLTVRDLLWHLPRRYSNRGELTPLTGLPVGEHVTVLAQVLDVRERRMQRRNGKLLEVRLTDGVGTLQLTFFNQAWRANELTPRARGIFAGKVSEYQGRLQLQHPDYELFEGPGAQPDEALLRLVADAGAGEATDTLARERMAALDEAAARAFAERPVPIYPATSKLASWVIQRAVGVVLDALDPVEDPLPYEIRSEAGVIALDQAFRFAHRPERAEDWRLARDSLRFREAFELQLALLDLRRSYGGVPGTPRPVVDSTLERTTDLAAVPPSDELDGKPKDRVGDTDPGLLAAFDEALPFELTSDQRRVAEVVSAELAQPHPMHRLLQGEVGSGKTVVALRAMLQVAETMGQSALLAPTEVLAAQHFRSVTEALGPALMERLHPVLLTSKMPTAEKRRALLSIASGEARLVVGTHALLSEGVSFYDLGFVVIDEQHRFGVEQREALRQKGFEPHLLAMTATPIPRTVALTAFGDLETSVIRELPAGRQGIETFVVPVYERPAWAERAWLRAVEEVAAGRQVYVVCPAIEAGKREEGDDEESPVSDGRRDDRRDLRPEGLRDDRELASVEQTIAELRARPDYAGISLAALTGQMKPDEKDAVMRGFAAGDIDVLVATTVVEVGVNVQNASTMIVRDADRFGISQLHQLRGRVGRGEHPGLCLLLTTAEAGSLARERLEAVAATSDGFALAERDLELRREGDILGTAQSGGRSTLRLLRVAEHGELIARAREVAAALLSRDPRLESAPGLRDTLTRAAEQHHLDNLAKS